MPILQDIFDLFSSDERDSIVEDAGLTAMVIGGAIDVRINPEAVLASVLRRRRLSNEQFASIVRESAIRLSNREATDTISVSLRFPEELKKAVLLNHLTATSIVLCETSLLVADILAEVSERKGILEPPIVENVFVGSTGLIITGANEMVAAVGFLVQTASAVLSHADPTVLAQFERLATLATVAGAARVVERMLNWRKVLYEGTNQKLDAELKRRELKEKASAAPVLPASSGIVIENLNVYVGSAALSPALATQLANMVLPSTVELLKAAGRPEVSVTISTPPADDTESKRRDREASSATSNS